MANTYPNPPALQTRFITARIDDVSTAGSYWVVPGFRCRINKISSVIDGALAAADADLSFEIGGTAVTSGGITITQSGSAAGDVDTASPTAANIVAEDGAIEMITDGGSTNTVAAVITFELEPF